MSSVVFKFDTPEEVSDIIYAIKHKGTMLELSPMSFGEVGDDAPYDRLLVIGDDAEIQRKFIEILGFQWRDFIVQGHVKDNEEQVV